MNRISKGTLAGGKNVPAGPHHQRGRSLNGLPRDTDEYLDLFSRNRRSLSIASSDESEVSMKLKRLSMGSATLARSGLDDLLSSVDGGKNDYDWLLTPPGTPLFPSSDASDPRPAISAPRTMTRSPSTTRSSRLSVAQSENSSSSRPSRSSSVTRPSLSTTHYNATYSSNSNRSSSFLNTSSASITSSRPSTPTARSSLPSVARASTPSSRPVLSRPSSPSKSRTNPVISSNNTAQISQSPRPSTPSTRPQTPSSNGNSLTARSNSRPSTPTRRNLAATPAQAAVRSSSASRIVTSGRNQVAPSRGSSPGPRVRPQPIVPQDFSLDTPPNLRTTLPDRPVSAGRSRPGVAVTMRGNSEVQGPVNPPKRHSSPVVARGRLPELSRRGHLFANGDVGAPESQKTPPGPALRRPVKPSTANESNGFGRTISKKSLDMALKHMDIRHGTGSVRSMSGTTLFPQSVRVAPKIQHGCALNKAASVTSNGCPPAISENGNCNNKHSNEEDDDNTRFSAKFSEVDIYESSRYDAMLLKEDLKNTNWLSDSDQGFVFDHRFEAPLPEPFCLL